MTLTAIAGAGEAINLRQMKGRLGGTTIEDILKELQGLKFFVVTGQDVNTNMAVTGITTADTILATIAIDGDAVLASSVIQPVCTITTNGNIQCAATDLRNYRVVVVWWDKVP